MTSWLDAAFTKHAPAPASAPAPTPTPDGDRWAAKAYADEMDTLARTTEGSRNSQLNVAAYNLGQIIGAGYLDETQVRDALTATARAIGLDDDEIPGTIRSGLEDGKLHPRGPRQGVASASAPPIAAFAVDTTDPDDLAAAVVEALPRVDWHALWADTDTEEWIIEPLLPARRLVALYSPPKVGKSLLMLELAVAVATGGTALGAQVDRPRRVLYVDFENDPKADIRERLTAMGHGPDDLDNLVLLSFPTLAGLDGERGALQLLAAVDAYQCEVVVVDTVSRSVDGDENDNDTWLSFYRHTGLKLKRAGVALIRLDHTGKDETRGQRGGSAKGGDVDAVWRMSRIDDDNYRLDCEMNRMPVSERTLVVERKPLPHLHHAVRPEGRAATFGIKVEATNRALDALGAANDVSNKAARELLKTTGFTVESKALAKALNVRKVRFAPSATPAERSTHSSVPHHQRNAAERFAE